MGNIKREKMRAKEKDEERNLSGWRLSGRVETGE